MSTWSVPNTKKGPFNNKIRSLERRVANYDNTCLFVIDANGKRCRLPAANCHSIPRASVLGRLRDNDGTVLDLGWGMRTWRGMLTRYASVDLNSSSQFEPTRTGPSKASIGRFACAMHDKAFSPIDLAQPDQRDSPAMLLMAYRIALFACDAWRKYGVFLYSEAIKEMNDKPDAYPRKERKEMVRQQNLMNPVLPEQIDKFGKLWHEGRLPESAIQSYVVDFRSKLKFALAVMVGTRGPYVTVTPGEDDAHVMTMTCHRSDKSSARKHVTHLKQLADASRANTDYGVEVVTQLLSRTLGSVVARPHSYEALSDEERVAIQASIHRQSRSDILQQIFSSGSASSQKP